MIEIRNSPTLRRYSDVGWSNVGGQTIVIVEADTLVGADLRQRNLAHADFRGADLRRADFAEARLEGAHFQNADLSEADFEGAHIWGGDFRGAHLRQTNFANASLVGARLQGVDLRDSNLHNTTLRFARYDESTLWPEGIDPQVCGAKLPSQIRP